MQAKGAFNNFTKITFGVKVPEGKEIIIKVANIEVRVTGTGEYDGSYSLDLSSLTVDGYELDSKFDKETLEYSVTVKEGTEKIPVITEGTAHFVSCAMPIIAEGDITGAIISGWQYDTPTSEKLSDAVESKLIQTAGIFLGKQMES